MVAVLDKGYANLIETWGSDERIVESARMSTAKGFLGWGPKGWRCDAKTRVPMSNCTWSSPVIDKPEDARSPWVNNECPHCGGPIVPIEGDEKLLKFLWDNAHGTPFEMAGLTIEVKAPIMVFREWHRHRVPFGYNEVSARYVPLPDENYLPTIERLIDGNQKALSTTNRQAQGSGAVLSRSDAEDWLRDLERVYQLTQQVYEDGIALGVPKELARLPVPVARYSAMRATGNLRGWLGFLKLRCAPTAQWEIRQYADAVAAMIKDAFPRTYEVAREGLRLP